MTIKQRKISLDRWGDYKKFTKKIVDDEDTFTQLAASTGRAKTAVVESNPDAETLLGKAQEALQSKDFNSARDALAKAERLNPKQPNLWWTYAGLYLQTNQTDKAFESLRKEVQIHPDSVGAYRALAQMLVQFGRRKEAIDALHSLLKLVPGDANIVLTLAQLLASTQRYSEIPDLLKQPLEQTPDNPQLQLQLADALLHTGRQQEASAAIQKVAGSNASDGNILNDTAYLLADSNTDLTLAKQYAEKSVSLLESNSKQVTLSNVGDEDLGKAMQIAAAWDTLGWVYFQLGDHQKAETYLSAAWRFTQRGVVGDHLGQLYAKEGNQKSAIHMWQLALASDGSLEAVRERLRKAGAPMEFHQAVLTRRALASSHAIDAVSPGEELSKLRTTSIPDLPKQEGSATFWILLSAGKVEDVLFASGSESLKIASASLLKAHYDVPFPDDGPEKIVRRGILSCSTYTTPSCEFVLLPR